MFKDKVMFYMMRCGLGSIGRAGFERLTKEGEEEVRRSAKKNLMGIKFAGIYSSPTPRACLTARVVLNTINDGVTRSGQLDIERREEFRLDHEGDSLKEIISIASEIARGGASSDGKRNIIVVTHSSNILACSGACPTMPKPNYADIVRLEVEVTDSSARIVFTGRIPRGF